MFPIVFAERKENRYERGWTAEMKIGRVIDTIWATRKDKCLRGVKLMIVQLLENPVILRHPTEDEGRIIVAADMIGAGIGEKVVVVEGSSARFCSGLEENAAIDAMIVAIIDENEWGVDKEGEQNGRGNHREN